METLISALYYLGTLSIFVVAVVYPQYWAAYANRPTYELVNYSNYSTIVSTEAKGLECYRIMDPYMAQERLKFANEINTWFVLFFTICDWIFMMFCSVGAMFIFYKSKKNPGNPNTVKAHIFIEFLSLVSLLVISPLSYPSLIDDYADCLDDNPFMRYDFFLFIQISFFVVIFFTSVQLLLFQNEEFLVEKYGKHLYSWSFYTVRNFTGVLLCGFFAVSLIITIGTNSLLILTSVVLDSGVGIYILYMDSLKNQNLADLLPMNPKSQLGS